MKRATWFVPIIAASSAIWFVILFLFQFFVVDAVTTKWPDNQLLYFLFEPFPYITVSTLVGAGILIIAGYILGIKKTALKPIAIGLLFGDLFLLLGGWYLSVQFSKGLI